MIFPRQRPYQDGSSEAAAPIGETIAVDAEEAETAARRLREEISQELWDNQDALRGLIYNAGYREPDLSEIVIDAQARYYRARMKPNFVFTGGPWPFLVHCSGYARKDFHRRQDNLSVPVEKLPEPDVEAKDALVDRVNEREAIKVFLEKYLPDPSEREIYLLTHGETMGPVEIARKLGIDRKTVTARLKRAEERLKSLPPDELGTLR
ncbi:MULTISPECIES: sigma-70 family RNA polymerase sigma factor [unclassified Streptomyces]|uniref:sigma-70 family RNA polymerase sigma factor n=1 Tax=unclassified Streptomyces TaxID=2593676 RepID=UPI0015A36A9A|nr:MULTISPECIES: sigma-70 family RNA polymerase sigma factor [unclassified Streptomyces]